MPLDDLLVLVFARLYSTYNLFTLQFLESEDLIELSFELSDEGSFVVVGPCLCLVVISILRGLFQRLFQAIVVYVVPVIVLDQGLSKLLAKPVNEMLANHGAMGVGYQVPRTSCWYPL